MAFTGALSTFVWSNLGWMRWVSEQGELSCSVHCHTSDCPALSRFIFLCCAQRLASVDVVELERPRLKSSGGPTLEAFGVPAIFGLFFCVYFLSAHSPASGPANSQLLKVGPTEGLKTSSSSSSSPGTSESSVSVLDFLVRVGGSQESGERNGRGLDQEGGVGSFVFTCTEPVMALTQGDNFSFYVAPVETQTK